ncbi:hypothetical protein PIB30_081481 [Stylosanthes scabra]|uniref:Uncharacterized protein n=1 Tax=Stylosanthes scabra TaxID=79078 RepID=A0ABU6QSA4_9FABA|nr:hypothetical protein [Stylosanthes scabra]
MPASNGAEDFIDNGTESNAEVSASAKGKWTGAIAAVCDGGLRARLLRRFFLLTLPPLLATTTIFPWDRAEVKTRERKTVTYVATVEDDIARHGTGDVGLAVRAVGLWDGTAPRRASVEVVSGGWNEREGVTTLDDLMGSIYRRSYSYKSPTLNRSEAAKECGAAVDNGAFNRWVDSPATMPQTVVIVVATATVG